MVEREGLAPEPNEEASDSESESGSGEDVATPFGVEHRVEAKAALDRIEALVRSSKRIGPERREALLEAARDLERALEPAAEVEPARVRSVASAAELAVHEAAHEEPHHPLVERALAALDEAAKPLEERAPRVVEAVGRIAELLANLGI